MVTGGNALPLPLLLLALNPRGTFRPDCQIGITLCLINARKLFVYITKIPHFLRKFPNFHARNYKDIVQQSD